MITSLNWILKNSGAMLSNMVASNHVWPFRFKLIKNYTTFPLSYKVLLDYTKESDLSNTGNLLSDQNQRMGILVRKLRGCLSRSSINMDSL